MIEHQSIAIAIEAFLNDIASFEDEIAIKFIELINALIVCCQGLYDIQNQMLIILLILNLIDICLFR
jgi:hypothetical protein